MSDAERGQVPGRAAEVDDALFVPAPFAEWPPRMARGRVRARRRNASFAQMGQLNSSHPHTS